MTQWKWAAMLAAGLSGIAAAQDCPAVSVDPEASNLASYPGGQPGRRKQDYMYIASILSVSASCESTKGDKVVADITVTYAVAAGTLYQGAANVGLSAVAREGTAETGRGASHRKSAPRTDGKAVAVTDIIQGVVVGDEDAVDDGKITVTVGLTN